MAHTRLRRVEKDIGPLVDLVIRSPRRGQLILPEYRYQFNC
jgi:hypothetical protein